MCECVLLKRPKRFAKSVLLERCVTLKGVLLEKMCFSKGVLFNKFINRKVCC